MMSAHLFRIGKGASGKNAWFRGALLALLLVCTAAWPAAAEKRVALVIGNGKYGGDIGPLANPPNDAKLMAEKLGALGFQVIKLVDGDQKAMKRAISDFGEKLTQAGPEAVGLFFYAGHGVQIGGANYLMPVGAEVSREADAEIEAVNADWVLKQMQFAGNRVNIVLLDACRNNPLTRSFRSGDRGLARMDAPTGTFIGYSTAPGEVAADGNGRNSPYVTALASELGQPGVALEETFRNVRVRVMAETAERQVPWDSSSLTGAFFFQPGAKPASVVAAPPPAPVPAGGSGEAGETERMFWDTIQGSQDPAEFQAYLDSYPNGKFAPLARAKIARLGGGEKTTTQVASTERSPEPVAAPTVAPAQTAALAPAPEPAPKPAPEPMPIVPPGTLLLSDKVAGQLDHFLRTLQQGKAIFAVSADGQYSGQYICEMATQCVPGKRSLSQNRDPNFARKEALRLCESRAKGSCTVIMSRDEKVADFVRP